MLIGLILINGLFSMAEIAATLANNSSDHRTGMDTNSQIPGRSPLALP